MRSRRLTGSRFSPDPVMPLGGLILLPFARFTHSRECDLAAAARLERFECSIATDQANGVANVVADIELASGRHPQAFVVSGLLGLDVQRVARWLEPYEDGASPV